MGTGRIALAALVLMIGALPIGLSARAGADISESGNLPMPVHFSITPVRLPRYRQTPVQLQIGIRFGLDSTTPRLSELALELNSRVIAIDGEALPRCGFARLTDASVREAERACADAKVGQGNFTRAVPLPENAHYPSHSEPFVAYNGRYRGQPAILAHIVANDPPLNYVIAFAVSHTSRSAVTSLVGTLPGPPLDTGIPTAFEMTLGRHYDVDGVPHGFLSASCPVPESIGELEFARLTYGFEDGTKLSTSLERACRATG